MISLLNRKVKINSHYGTIVAQDFVFEKYLVEFDDKNLIPPEMEIQESLISMYLVESMYGAKCDCGLEAAYTKVNKPLKGLSMYQHALWCDKRKASKVDE